MSLSHCRKWGTQFVEADLGIYPPMSDLLSASGIEMFEGYDAERLAQLDPDWVVVGNVISRGNPEIEWLWETRAISYLSLPEALHKWILSQRKNIVVTGTHGKTTTSTITSFLLEKNNFNPSFLIGGVPLDFGKGCRIQEAGGPFCD